MAEVQERVREREGSCFENRSTESFLLFFVASLLESRCMRHWHREPAPATQRFVERAPLEKTTTGLKAVLEITIYPAGHVAVVASKITGSPGARTIRQHGDPLMFNDPSEAKDAIDELVDRVAREAAEE